MSRDSGPREAVGPPDGNGEGRAIRTLRRGRISAADRYRIPDQETQEIRRPGLSGARPDEYERLADIEFPDQETLKTYLREMCDYLFNDGPEQPMPPEQSSMKATRSFAIQAGRPALRECRRAADMRDAVGEMYALGVEDAILVWNRVPVRLSYGYDVAILLDDLVPLLEEVRRPEFSDAEVFWGSDTFSAEWKIVREDDLLRIRARWHSVLGNYESLLTERGDAVVHTEVFVSEWSKVLRRIVTDIDAEFVDLNDDDIFLRVKSLIRA